MPRSIGLAALTVLELTPPEMVSCAVDAGFDCAGLRVLDVEIFRLRPETVVGDYEAALATGARLGATEALVAGNDPDEARLTANFAAFCELAQQFSIGGNLEPMPWTDCKSFAQGVRIVTASAHDNGGILIDPIHFDRGGSSAGEISGVPRARFRYMQLCDAPAERPTDIEGLLRQARSERLMPGDGGLDLTGILRVLPADLPIGLEIPMETLARTVPAVERARQMLAKTR